MFDRMSALVLAGSAAVLLTGCGGEKALPAPTPSPVRGAVLFNGNPVKGVYFTLQPVDHTAGAPARGTTDDNGNFDLRTFNTVDPDGAVPGVYFVEFVTGIDGLPADINKRKMTVEVKGGEEDLQINIE